jgi:hypothetical protein
MIAAPSPAEIELDFPIEVGGKTVSRLIMRAPEAPDFFRFRKGSEASRGAALLAHLCGVRPGDIGELAPSDLTRIAQQYQLFMRPWL